MKLNPDKCNLLVSWAKRIEVSVHIGEITVTESVEEKLLGVMVDKNLDFKKHVNVLYYCTKKRKHSFLIV